MGLENMRRWPMYIVFGVCIFLVLSLLNSWSLEGALQDRIGEMSLQIQDCSHKQSACNTQNIALAEDKEIYKNKVSDLHKQKSKLITELDGYKNTISKYESKINHTLVDVDLCKTELQSLKNLQVSKSATLETLRLEKDTLTTQLNDRKQKIEELEKEVEKLKLSLSTKTIAAAVVSKVTPAAQVPILNPLLNAPINEPEPMGPNDAKEEMEDSNALNDGNEMDPSIQ